MRCSWKMAGSWTAQKHGPHANHVLSTCHLNPVSKSTNFFWWWAPYMCARRSEMKRVAAVGSRLLLGHSKLCFSCWFDGLFLWRIGEPSEWRHSSTSYYARQPRHFFLEKSRGNMARALRPVFFGSQQIDKESFFSFFFCQKKKELPNKRRKHFTLQKGGRGGDVSAGLFTIRFSARV